MKPRNLMLLSMLFELLTVAVWLMLVGLQLLALVAVCAVSVLGTIWLVRALLGWF